MSLPPIYLGLIRVKLEFSRYLIVFVKLSITLSKQGNSFVWLTGAHGSEAGLSTMRLNLRTERSLNLRAVLPDCYWVLSPLLEFLLSRRLGMVSYIMMLHDTKKHLEAHLFTFFERKASPFPKLMSLVEQPTYQGYLLQAVHHYH